MIIHTKNICTPCLGQQGSKNKSYILRCSILGVSTLDSRDLRHEYSKKLSLSYYDYTYRDLLL